MKFQRIPISGAWKIILSIALIKLIIHLIVSTNYELHRDAYLYLAQSDHLAWGYASVPPSIAVFGKLITSLFGYSALSIRLLPALLGSTSVIIVGLIVKELKGKNTAILIACLAFLLSPAYLRTNSLFQPVVFNQFYWLLSGFIIIKLIKTYNPKYWIILFIIWGFAFMNKYSISFFILAFFLALLITKHRKLLLSKYFLIGTFTGLIIILPNLIWQFNHDWPVIQHMQELQKSQLVHVKPVNFILDQFIMNFHAVWVWLIGLFAFIFLKQERQYQLLAWLYLFILLILLTTSGKSYYTLGVYPILFALGGYAAEKYLANRLYFLRYIVIAFLFTGIPLIPYGLPVFGVEKMEAYSRKTAHLTNNMLLRWEDGKIHRLPQDFADMIGWKELSKIVVQTYQDLPSKEKENCLIYAENYGQAGAVKYYGKKHGLPEPISFSDSFLWWAPDSIDSRTLIYINDKPGDIEQLFNEYKVTGALDNPLFRENGLKIYLCRNPKDSFPIFYARMVKELKRRNGIWP